LAQQKQAQERYAAANGRGSEKSLALDQNHELKGQTGSLEQGTKDSAGSVEEQM